MNENENTPTPNPWDTVKAVLKGMFIALQAYLKKQEKSQINNLTLQLKHLEKEEMKNTRVNRRIEMLKIRAYYLKKQGKSQINNLTRHRNQLEMEEMRNPRVSRRKGILKIRAEINAKETKETIAKINKAKSCFFSKNKQN